MGGLVLVCFSWLWTVRYPWYGSPWWFPVAWVSVDHCINNCIGSLSRSFTLWKWLFRDSCSSHLLLLLYLHCLSNLSVFSIVLSPAFFLFFIASCHVSGSIYFILSMHHYATFCNPQPSAKTIDSYCTLTFLQSVRARLHLNPSKWILWMTHRRKACVLPVRLEGVWNQPSVSSDR